MCFEDHSNIMRGFFQFYSFTFHIRTLISVQFILVWKESESESRSVGSDSCDPMDYTIHGILQARILEWVAFPFSGGYSQHRDRTQVSYIAGGFFTSWATREALILVHGTTILLYEVSSFSLAWPSCCSDHQLQCVEEGPSHTNKPWFRH